MKSKRIQKAFRTALTDLIIDVIETSNWDTPEKEITGFACLYTRIMHDKTDIAYITALSNFGQNKQKQNYGTYQLATKINAYLHQLKDEDGDLVFNQATGGLSTKWQTDMVDIAHSMEAIMPEEFLPTNNPKKLCYPSHGNGVQLINTHRKFAFQDNKSMPLVYDALNALQSQEFVLSHDMLTLKNLPVAILTTKNFAARHVMLTNMESFSGKFHFRYTMDYRGRVYCRALFAHIQGDSFAKAFIQFAESKPLSKYGHSALKIHFANSSGHDKLSFTDRIKWANEKGLLKAYNMVTRADNDWNKVAALIEDKKHAYEEYAAACEIVRADQWLEQGKDIKDFQSALITHQDATNSGFQFGAALTGSREQAEDVNITDRESKHDKPADLYNKMAVNLKPLVQAIRTKLPEINRTFCKKPIMVTGYGAGTKAVIRDIIAWSEKEKTNPLVTEETGEELKPHVEQALAQTAAAMVETTHVMHQHAEEILASGAELIEWYAPDGFRIVQQKRDNSGRKIELSNKQVTFKKNKVGELDPVDEKGMTTALPPNFIHSMDAQMLRTAAIMCKEQGIHFAPIHDSFGTHAGTFWELNTALKQAFVQTMKYPWYLKFCESNNIQPININQGDYKVEECLNATYMFS